MRVLCVQLAFVDIKDYQNVVKDVIVKHLIKPSEDRVVREQRPLFIPSCSFNSLFLNPCQLSPTVVLHSAPFLLTLPVMEHPSLTKPYSFPLTPLPLLF